MTRIAFFGTPPLTIEILDALAASGYTPSLIVTNPDAPQGRGMILTSPLPKQWADERSIAVLQPKKITDDIILELKQQEWDLFIVVAYGAILPQALIDIPTHGTINIHYSLLPQYRGATPVEAAILAGDTRTGVCIQKMVYVLDAGPIIAQEEESIHKDDTTVTLRGRLNTKAATLLVQTLPLYLNGSITPIAQDESKATRCKKIKKEDGCITLEDDPILLDRKYRAYQPWPGLYFFVQKNDITIRVKIKTATFDGHHFIPTLVIPENMKPMTMEAFRHWMMS